MAQQKIYLRKVRDFGENLGDTFQYLRQEFRPLMSGFLLISGVFMLGAAIVSGIFQTEFTDILEDMSKNDGFDGEMFGVFLGRYLVIIVFMLVAFSAMQTVVACYMKLYDANGTSPSLEQVWSEFRRYYLKILLLALIKLVIYCVTLPLCILPGVYLMIVYAPMTWIVVNEDATIGEAFSRCFALAREQFWLSLGIYVVAYVIYSFSSGIIGLILGMFIGISSYMTTKEIDSTMGVVTAVTNLFNYLFYIVFAIAVGLNYYNLVERRDGVGMMRRLDTFGTTAGNNQSEEQY